MKQSNKTKLIKAITVYSCLFQLTGDMKFAKLYNYFADKYVSRKRITNEELHLEKDIAILNIKDVGNKSYAEKIQKFFNTNKIGFYDSIGIDKDGELCQMN